MIKAVRFVPFLAFLSLAALQTLAAAAQGPTESVLYAFPTPTSPDGDFPLAPLIADANGALYGTTTIGGNGPCFLGCGTVFKLTPSASGYYPESVLYNFQGPDGRIPMAGLLADASGDLFGTTARGGGTQCPDGCGTVFELIPTASGYKQVVIYRFRPDHAGKFPKAGLIADAGRSLYGTTERGGRYHFGTVFRLKPAGSGYFQSTLYDFAGGGNDGAFPVAGLVMDRAGALYGTTSGGGGNNGCYDGCGTVFALRPLSHSRDLYHETVIHAFTTSGGDGIFPLAGLIIDQSGALYGTASAGGGSSCAGGCGVVFRLTPSGSTYSETILHDFGTTNGDDCRPVAGLIADRAGNLFGTAAGNDCATTGNVYELKPSQSGSYTEITLYQFLTQPNDGYEPDAPLIKDSHGTLYGTTYVGGSYGSGTVFKIVP